MLASGTGLSSWNLTAFPFDEAFERMASLTIANYLGTLQADPENTGAVDGIREAIASGDPARLGERPLRLLEAARHEHEKRAELEAVARLIELELLLTEDDGPFQVTLLKELGRLRRDELMDDAGAMEALARARALLEAAEGPEAIDDELDEMLEELQQLEDRWRDIADRFVEVAGEASDATLKTSMLARAGSVVWQYASNRAKETDKLFKQALRADPASVRAARLYCLTLAERERWEDVATVLTQTGDAARNRDEKLNLYLRAARTRVARLEDREGASHIYERVLDFVPGHAEALTFLVEYFTEREMWDHLVALYEDALRSRQKLEDEQGILLQIGMVHWRIRHQAEEAEPYFARLRKIEPAHATMLAFYRETLGNRDDDDAKRRLVTVLNDARRVAAPEQQLALALEVARAAQESGATERAIDAWKAVQRLDAAHEEAGQALRRLYRDGEKWNALVEVMRAELDSLPARSEDEAVRTRRVALLKELVVIYRGPLKLDVMVINTFKLLLEEVPEEREALAELAATYESMGRWNDLVQVLGQQAEVEEDQDARIALLMRVARLWIDRFANYNQATKPLEAIIGLAPEHRETLTLLKTIYTKKRAWHSLYEVLEREAALASDPDARLALKVETARLAGDRLHQNAQAIALWKDVLAEAPDTEGGLDTLERLAEREKDWATLAEVLERRARERGDAPDAERIKVLQKLGTVYGESLGEPAKAASVWQRILAIDPRNGRALRTLRESFIAARDWAGLEALYAEAGDWEGLVDVLGSAAERSEDPELTKELSFRAAGIYEEQLGKPERAFRSYERVLATDPADTRAARALLPIYEAQEKWVRLRSLHEVLLEAEAEQDLDAQLARLATLQKLSARRLGDEEAAFSFARRGFDLAPERPETLARLEEATELEGRWADLVAVLEARLAKVMASEDASTDATAETMGLRRRLAQLAGERLGRSDEAIAQLQSILAADPDDAEALAVLDGLFRSEERSDELRGLYLHRLGREDAAGPRVALLRELAKLEEDVLGDREAAAERYREARSLAPEDRDVLAALDRLALSGERWEELEDVLGARRALGDESDALTLRLGALRREHLGDLDGSQSAYRAVLEAREPGDERYAEAVAGLEAVAAASEAGSERRLAIGRLLEPAYVATERPGRLAKVLEERLESEEDEGEKRALRLRLADLATHALGDADAAYAALEAAFLDAPEDASLAERLAEAAEAAGEHESLAQAFAAALERDSLDAASVLRLSQRVAELLDVVLARPASAEPHHRRVLVHEPRDERAFLALKELYTNDERWDELQMLYRNRIAETVDGEARLELLLQVCFLFEEILEDPELAIRSYQEILELVPDH
ncbi:MAG: hypothetical protein AAF447_15740 [Myxococcota bacterium]